MEGADALGLIAEVGIAIAGFAGVIAALRAQGGRLRPFEAARIGALLAISAAAVLLALLPFGLHFAGVNAADTWAGSSLGMLVLVGWFQIAAWRRFERLVRSAPEAASAHFGRSKVYGTAALTVANLLQLANVLWFQQLWPFYLGLLVMTAHGLYVFALTLFVPSTEQVPA